MNYQPQLWSVLEALPDAVVVIDHDGRIILASAQTETMFGYRREELIGQPVECLLPERYRRSHVERRAEFAAEPHTRPIGTGMELYGQRKDGSEFPVDISLGPLNTEKGLLVTGVIRDITARVRVEEQLRLRGAALVSAANAIVMTDREGCILWVNPAFSRLTGYTAEEAVGQTPRILKSGTHDQPFYQNLWETVLAGEIWRGETVNRRKDGSLYTEEQIITPVRDTRGEIAHFIAIKQDITERKRAQQALSQQLEELTVLHAVAVIGAEATDEDTLIERATEVIGKTLYPDDFGVLLLAERETGGVLRPHPSYRGLPESDRGLAIPLGNGIVGGVAASGQPRRISDTLEEPAYLDAVPNMRSELCVPLVVGVKEPAAARNGQAASALPHERVIGVINAERAQLRAFSEDDERLMVTLAGQLATAIEKVRLFAETQRLATTDALTGLYNRRHFFELAGHEYERTRRYGGPFSAIMLDIDHFKRINDTYGHAAGDQVLRAVAALCRESLREVDVVGRYGGEEFALILPESDVVNAQIAAERLCQQVAQQAFATDRGPLSVTVSLGVASLDDSCVSLDGLLERADRALYAAKQAGRNQVCVAGE
ncbi:MAG: diguanylate cyclase [Chloroflexi bacterium]|nr:diguanylate cyclase [Chloroflexota bacterium]